jgi:hypothetical protein
MAKGWAGSRAERGKITSGIPDLPKLSCNFCNIYVIYKSGRGPRVEDTWPKEMSDL